MNEALKRLAKALAKYYEVKVSGIQSETAYGEETRMMSTKRTQAAK